jgi:peptidoglycan hydrolase-like protein with peptidoglycan-binding domain
MAFSLTWLPEVLKAAGLKVALVDGWETRGRAEMGKVFGVICHHTATQATGNMPTLGLLIRGRSDLAGPLAQLGLGRDGTFYVIAAGKANHAGEGRWQGIVNGNTNFIGIEAENTGSKNDRWPDVQLDAYYRGVAAILKHVGRSEEFCCAHREYALPKGRKGDIIFDMKAFRASVRAILEGTAPPVLIPKMEPVAPRGGPARPTIRRGRDGDLVEEVQRLLGVAPVSGHFGPKTEAAVRAFQRARGMVADGIIGPKSWQALDEFRAAAPPPPPHLPGVPAPAIPPALPITPSVGALAWGAKVSAEFRKKVHVMAKNMECDPSDLMACMAFESGETFDPGVKNQAGSGATGLIQFMPTTAKDLGTSTDKLAMMTAEEQLDYVAKYFAWYPEIRSLEDIYMAILWPRAIGKPNDYVLFEKPGKRYGMNKGLDENEDGRVTKFEAAAAVREKLVKGLEFPFVG